MSQVNDVISTSYTVASAYEQTDSHTGNIQMKNKYVHEFFLSYLDRIFEYPLEKILQEMNYQH